MAEIFTIHYTVNGEHSTSKFEFKENALDVAMFLSAHHDITSVAVVDEFGGSPDERCVILEYPTDE